jgi:hypothetical protein
MRHKAAIRALLEAAEDAAHEQLLHTARITLRKAWAKQRVADFFAAQKRVQEAWKRIFDALPDDLDEEELEAIPEPPEQAEADAIYAEIQGVLDHDRWPRHLYWIL